MTTVLARMSLEGMARRGFNGINKHLSRLAVPICLRSGHKPDLAIEFLGKGDGAWPIVPSILPAQAICYCIGVGVNASFDIELANKGFEVHSFDPTPNALTYAQNTNLSTKGITFHPIGVWNEEKTLRFFSPGNTAHANFSVVDLHGTGEFVEAKCERLSWIMQRLGHEEIDLLKLDVEGSWGPILEDMIDSKIFPGQLCVEFDSPTSTRKILSMIRLLARAGYQVAWFNRENFLFVRTSK
jgi:FkbM family methyltransferase